MASPSNVQITIALQQPDLDDAQLQKELMAALKAAQEFVDAA